MPRVTGPQSPKVSACSNIAGFSTCNATSRSHGAKLGRSATGTVLEGEFSIVLLLTSVLPVEFQVSNAHLHYCNLVIYSALRVAVKRVCAGRSRWRVHLKDCYVVENLLVRGFGFKNNDLSRVNCGDLTASERISMVGT